MRTYWKWIFIEYLCKYPKCAARVGSKNYGQDNEHFIRISRSENESLASRENKQNLSKHRSDAENHTHTRTDLKYETALVRQIRGN